MNVTCPAHEGRRAHHGCHFCLRPICRLCEVRMRGHLYCSTQCARDFGRHAVWRRAADTLGIEVPSRLALLCVALIGAAPVVLALRAVGELDRLNEPSRFAVPRRGASARIDVVTETPSGATIVGRAPAGAAIFLFAGGKFVGTMSAENDTFRFEGVRPNGPYRVGAIFLSQEAPVVPSPRPTPSVSTLVAAAPFHPAVVRPLDLSALTPGFPDMSIGPRDRREVLVSFDAGSSDRGAEQILDALKERGIRTTIFLTGEFIRRSPELARRIASDGHEAGNHTHTHLHLTTYAQNARQATRPGVDRAFLARELSTTARLYRETTGKTMAPIWRAPFGEHNPEIRRWAAEEGYWHVGWTGGRAGLDALDWVSDPASPAYRSADKVVALLVQRAESGGIVLLHLGSDRDVPVASRIGVLFDGLAGRGFRFARATEFLDREGLTVERLAALSGRGAAAAR
ncbi:MAG TPA: polysaccharide deacetylase family protein [Thermoanaerobaculia bacterium]|nr:polysaccharide deacetylase family protein [Thermoanaerobaculia bacterium]